MSARLARLSGVNKSFPIQKKKGKKKKVFPFFSFSFFHCNTFISFVDDIIALFGMSPTFIFYNNHRVGYFLF